ncbi:MAG: plasmid pRiA4b ORF-3 family protein [Gammaproteobacteria bacterium]|nr:plasmid pRiA4b ORF-3 family protein [Gammaproteobacteria bacterium]
MNLYEVKLTLQGVAPPIWRRLQVPAATTLDVLHNIVQIAMGWKNIHLHMFIVNGEEYGVTDPDLGTTIRDESKAVLGKVAEQGDRLMYVYDFGDEWEHEILIERVFPAEEAVARPRCIDGERACPPEDCGGPAGYRKMLAALADPQAPGHVKLLDRIGRDFEPEVFDTQRITNLLRWLSGQQS